MKKLMKTTHTEDFSKIYQYKFPAKPINNSNFQEITHSYKKSSQKSQWMV